MSTKQNRTRTLRTVNALIDRLASSPTNDKSLVTVSVDALLTDRLSVEGWTDDAVRAVLAAIVAHAPVEDLEVIEDWARDRRDFVEEYELEQRYFAATGKDLPHDLDREALKAAMVLAVAS